MHAGALWRAAGTLARHAARVLQSHTSQSNTACRRCRLSAPGILARHTAQPRRTEALACPSLGTVGVLPPPPSCPPVRPALVQANPHAVPALPPASESETTASVSGRPPPPPHPAAPGRGGGLFGITSSTLVRIRLSDLVRVHPGRPAVPFDGRGYGLERGAAGPDRRVYDYRCRGTPSNRLGRIHPYVRSCSAKGTSRERSD